MYIGKPIRALPVPTGDSLTVLEAWGTMRMHGVNHSG